MSRKTIPFQVPQKTTTALASPSLANISATEDAKVDQWVCQREKPAEILLGEPVAPGDAKRAATLTITVSMEPDWFDAWKIGVFLPYAAVWFWALGAARRGVRIFAH
jgi:hypothetical protein